MSSLATKKALLMAGGAAADIADLFATSLYTGTGAAQTITNGIDLAGNGGLVWMKGRSGTQGAASHGLYDTERGVENELTTNSTAAEINRPTALTAFNSNGWSMGSYNGINASSTDYVGWAFRRNFKFFDIVTFTHTNGVTSNVATGLTVPLGLATVKRLDSTSDWYTNHRSLTAGNNLKLNKIAAESASNAYVSFSGSTLVFDSAAPSGDYVAYVWGHDDSAGGVVQCGSYTGNGSTTGPVITLGWEPQWLLVRETGVNDWALIDAARSTTNPRDDFLRPNTSEAEDVNNANVRADFTSGGFQPVGTSTTINGNTLTYIYIAIRAPS